MKTARRSPRDVVWLNAASARLDDRLNERLFQFRQRIGVGLAGVESARASMLHPTGGLPAVPHGRLYGLSYYR